MHGLSFTKLSFAAVALVVTTTAFAQTYPNKPIRLIVPAVAGSAVDINARRITPKLSEYLGQPIIVENRAGANSMIGAREAARAPADGYTLYQANVNNALNDLLANDPCCRLNQELIAVTKLVATALVMVVHPSVPAANLQAYVALAKAKPNDVTYASGGTGAITQLLGERVKLAGNISVREIPYKSIGAEMPDLTAGHVMTGFLAPAVIMGHVKAGRLRALAVAGERRLSVMPDVPTMAEAGLPGVIGIGWNGIFVPAGTPAPIVQRLQQEITRVLNLPEIRDEIVSLGSEVGGESADAYAAYVRDDIARWGKVIKDAGIKLQ